MFQSDDERLETELLRIIREHTHPLNLEEIFSCLYDRRDRLADLVAVNKETVLEKRRVKRSLERSVYRGHLSVSWKNGDAYYLSAREVGLQSLTFPAAISRVGEQTAYSVQPHTARTRQHPYDQLLIIFCVIALGVITAGIIFLIMI